MAGGLDGKVAIITGGAGAIGLETARVFASEGASVALVDLDEGTLEKAVASVGNRTVGIAADVTDEADVRRYVATTLSRFSTIDIFFNNAGIESSVVPVIDVEAEDFDHVMRVNVRGVFLGLKHVLPVMYAKHFGSVINTSSVGGLHASPNMTPYVASKHAVVGLTKTVAVEAAPYGVCVNSIHPSAVNTRMMRALEEGYSPGSPDAAKAMFEQALPLKRYAEPLDVARLVLFLASDESTFITGAQYRVDGGQGAL